MSAAIELAIIAAVWVICAWLTMAVSKEWYLRRYGEWTVADRRFAALCAALGPVGLGGTLLGCALVASADSGDRVLVARFSERLSWLERVGMIAYANALELSDFDNGGDE